MTNQPRHSITARAFARLGQEKQLQEYSSIIYKMLGLVIDFISAEGETLRLSKGLNFNPFCSMLRQTPCGRTSCAQCDLEYAAKAAATREPICYTCYAGLHEIIVPLFDTRGDYIGAMTSGQYHLHGTPKLKKTEIAALAEKTGLKTNDLWKHYQTSITLTQKQVEGVVAYLQIIGRHLTGIREHLIFMEKVNAPAKLDEIKKYVDKHCCENISIGDVAQKFYISPDYLAHQFTKEMSLPFHRYVLFGRIARAKTLLQETRLSVKEISNLCGFGSASQFNRTFRNETGINARTFRLSFQRH